LFFGSGGRRTERSLVGCLLTLAAIAVVLGGEPGALSIAEAASAGTVSLRPAAVGPDTTVTVTVVDPDLNVMIPIVGETTGAGGVAHTLPMGLAGTTHVIRVVHTPIADASGDGRIGPEDVEISSTDAIVASVSAESGMVTVQRMWVVWPGGEPFSVTYSSDQIDSAIVRVTSDADSVGFDLTLLETAAASGEFTATVVVSTATWSGNAGSPSAALRPMIKAADGDLVNAAYSDASPLRVVSDAVPVDGAAPLVVAEAPPYDAALRTVTPWVTARVTDFGSGVGLDSIVFHVDVDRDGVFDEAGETVSPSYMDSEEIIGGFVARGLLPPLGADGATEWYATATDGVGNVGRSDADAYVSGSQNHRLFVDVSDPRLLSAMSGGAYDAAGDEVLIGQRDKMWVVYSETLDPASMNPGLFVVDGIGATAAVVYPAYPDTVWLTVPDLPSNAGLLEAATGAVKDTAGHDSARGQAWPTDGMPPRLQVSADPVATRGEVVITVVSDEDLLGAPTVELNNVTVGTAAPVDVLEWGLTVDVGGLAGAMGDDGVKNAEATGFDVAGNIGHGGVDSGAVAYPAGATRFELDRVLDTPVITPAYGATVTIYYPAIAASYAGEAGEYEGDSLSTVTPVLATLDGEDILARLTSADGATWTLQTYDLSRGEHAFTIQAVDRAGNTHAPAVVRFHVDADLPTPTPTATPAPTAAASPTPEVTPTAAPEPTAVPTAAPEPTATIVPAASATPEPSPSPGPEPTTAATLTPPPSATPTVAPAASATPEPSPAPGTEPTPAATSTPVPPAAPTVAPTADVAPELTPTVTAGPAVTPEAVRVPTPTRAPEPAPTVAATPTPVPEAEEEAPDMENDPALEESEPEASETAPAGLSDIDAEIEATVQALRAEALGEDGPGEEIEDGEAEESGYGPTARDGAGAAGADLVLYGVGLVGLMILAGRRRMNGGPG